MKTTAVVLLRHDLTIADPLQASDLAPLAQEATLQRLDDTAQAILADLSRRWSKVIQRVTADLNVAHGTGGGLQGLIPINVPYIHKVTVVDAPLAGAVSLFFGNTFGDTWAVPVKTGDVFDGLYIESLLQLPFSNAAAPGASLVLMVQGW